PMLMARGGDPVREEPDHRHRWLLRACCERPQRARRKRPRDSAAKQRNQRPRWEAASRMSAFGACGGAGDRPDVREHAAGVPGWEGPYQGRRAVELDAALAGGLGPGELAGVPFDEGFGFRR